MTIVLANWIERSNYLIPAESYNPNLPVEVNDVSYPRVIQGGLGVGVSNWRLARTVSTLGQMGVVSGTAMDQVLVRRLQDGDPGGHMREAFAQFPAPAIADRIWRDYYIPNGKSPGRAYALGPMQGKDGPRPFLELCILANFVEVYLARQGHSNPVGINFLEKLQPPHLASIYGAMLAGVDYVLMGAGIPMKIPGVLDQFVHHQPATYPLAVTGAQEGDDVLLHFDPKDFIAGPLPDLRRPRFLAIIASNTLAVTLARKANGRVDGFIVEGPIAGGHNAPPRGQLQLNDAGEPIYGERDRVDYAKLGTLGLPFWLAGGYGSAESLRDAIALGATGIQVGTAFAFCAESGMGGDLKRAVVERVAASRIEVFTDPRASPTGFPFKVAQVEGSVSEASVFEARTRVCDLGYLREAYRAPDGSIGFRCPSESQSVFVAKGGNREETEGRKCICNGLLAAIGMPQARGSSYMEPPVVTAGDDLKGIGRFLRPGEHQYTAADVISSILAGLR